MAAAVTTVLTIGWRVRESVDIEACVRCGRDIEPAAVMGAPGASKECAGCGHVGAPAVFADFASWEAFARSRQQTVRH